MADYIPSSHVAPLSKAARLAEAHARYLYAVQGHRVTPAQHRACLYLLRQGMTLGAAFGYENAPEMARAHRAARRRRPRDVR